MITQGSTKEKMKKFTIYAAIVLITMSACSKNEGSSSESGLKSKTPTPQVNIDLATPDKALKSYWMVRDSVRAKQIELFAKSKDGFQEIEAQMSGVADAALVKAFSFESAGVETFSRDLLDVKIESDSRAVIVVVIKNTTPIPLGAEMSKFADERRRDGERYKYVLEKSEGSWRVSEIWEWSTYPSSGWNKIRPLDDKPSVPSLTYSGI